METAPLTVEDLDALVESYFKVQAEKAEAEDDVRKINIVLAQMEAKLVEYLKAVGRKDYKHASGTVKLAPRWSVTMPATDLEKQTFFSWLKDKGIFDRYATVNSRSLQSLWNAERDAAIKEDPAAALDFNLPGLGKPSYFEGINKRKGATSE